MRKVMAGQVLTGLLFSLVLNLPVLLVRGGTGRRAAVVVLALLLVGAVVSKFRSSGGTREVRKTGSGVVTGSVGLQPHSGSFNGAAYLARVQKRQRLAKLQLPALAVALVAGSVVGAVSGPWWAEILGGAIGYGVVVIAVFRLLFPSDLLKAARPL